MSNPYYNLGRMLPEVTPDIYTAEQTAIDPPYRIIIHNDDVTPMDFVVHVLLQIFFLSTPEAMDVMYTAHYLGAAYVQTCGKSEAEKRVARAHFAAGLEGYPLHFSIEKE